jgi:hypothetical protein
LFSSEGRRPLRAEASQRVRDVRRGSGRGGQGSILQNYISAKNFHPQIWAKIPPQNQHIHLSIMGNTLGFKVF